VGSKAVRVGGRVPVTQFMKELYQEVIDDDIFNGAAALGFFLTLAIFPAMIFVMAVIPYLPVDHVDVAMMDLLRATLPPSAAEMFTGVVDEITREQRGGLLSLGLAGALWATSTGMYAVMQQLNVTYDVKDTRGFLKARLIAIVLSVLFCVLVVGGFTLIVLGGQLEAWLVTRYGVSDTLLAVFVVLRWLIILCGLMLAFAGIYFLAPDVDQRFVFITPGSIIGVSVLMLASLAFSWYARNFADYSATYGSVGAVILLMLWLYIAGLVILFGSEINALVEHHSAKGKLKGEHTEGQSQHDPAVRQQVIDVAPENGSATSRPKV